MLQWETRDSETFLNVEKLAAPFDYQLLITEDGQLRQQAVDLPETFNYLIGLHVRSRKVYMNGERRYLVYRGTVDTRETVVIWRDTEGWGEAEYAQDREFVVEQTMVEGADEVFVNGDSTIPGASSLDPVFKARMFGTIGSGMEGV